MQFFSSIILERRVPPQITSDLQFAYKNFLCNVFVVVLIAVVLAFFFDWQPIPRKTTVSKLTLILDRSDISLRPPIYRGG